MKRIKRIDQQNKIERMNYNYPQYSDDNMSDYMNYQQNDYPPQGGLSIPQSPMNQSFHDQQTFSPREQLIEQSEDYINNQNDARYNKILKNFLDEDDYDQQDNSPLKHQPFQQQDRYSSSQSSPSDRVEDSNKYYHQQENRESLKNDLMMCDFDEEQQQVIDQYASRQMGFQSSGLQQEALIYSRPETPQEQLQLMVNESFRRPSPKRLDSVCNSEHFPEEKERRQPDLNQEMFLEDNQSSQPIIMIQRKQKKFFFGDDMMLDDNDGGDSENMMRSQQMENSRDDLNREDEGRPEEDNYDNIGKWEEQNKENEINEIESLDFSVKREEYPDQQQYQSSNQQANESIILSAQPSHFMGNTESMMIFQSPNKQAKVKPSITPFTQQKPSIKQSNQILFSESIPKVVKKSSSKARILSTAPKSSSRTRDLQNTQQKLNHSTSSLNNHPNNNKALPKTSSITRLNNSVTTSSVKKSTYKPLTERGIVISQNASKAKISGSIQKIKDLFNTEEKYQRYERLHSQETKSSLRKRRGFNDQEEGGSGQNNASFTKDSQCTFRPKIDPVSNMISTSQMDITVLTQRTHDPCLFLYQRGMQMKVQKEKELEAKRQELENQQLQPCTFRPRSARPQEHSFDRQSIYERAKQWDVQRKNRLRDELEKSKIQELEGCTFSPIIQTANQVIKTYTNQGSPSKLHSRNGSLYKKGAPNQTVGELDRQYESRNSNVKQDINVRNQPGQRTQQSSLSRDRSIQKHFERIQQAKDKKLQKDIVFSKNNGSNWKNSVTKPNPPKITDIIIQNLQKKLNVQNLDSDQPPTKSKPSNLRSQRNSIADKKKPSNSREVSSSRKNKKSIDQDSSLMIHEQKLDNNNKDNGKALEFKDAVKFLRGALHQLNLES